MADATVTNPPLDAALDERHMRQALELARKTIGLASPNPQVGCVMVSASGEVLGEGAHLYDHFDHAEIVALKQVADKGLSPQGATAYVTLEPCSHHGRTGPCADALVAAGIVRCVVATTDPNPQVSGRGIQRLRDAGIEVTVGVLQNEARELNDAFAHSILTSRPLVMLKAALSADGMLAPEPSLRIAKEPHWLTGTESRAQVQRLRHASDAILTGIGTVLADNPRLTDRNGEPRRRPLLRVVLDTELRLHRNAQLVRSANKDLLLLCGSKAPQWRIGMLQDEGVEVERVESHEEGLSLAAVLKLMGERKILSLLLECGSKLNGSFLRHDLVDKAVLFHAPTTLGPDAIPFAYGAQTAATLEASLLRPTRQSFGADSCISGYLHDPWSHNL